MNAPLNFSHPLDEISVSCKEYELVDSVVVLFMSCSALGWASLCVLRAHNLLSGTRVHVCKLRLTLSIHLWKVRTWGAYFLVLPS